MKKRLFRLAVLSLSMVFSFSAASLAEEYTSEGITVTMPENWEAAPQIANMTMAVWSPDDNILLGFQIVPSNGVSEKYVAEQTAALIGFEENDVPGLGRYSIRGDVDGAVYAISMFEHGGLLLTTHTVSQDGNEQDLIKVWKTARSSDPKVQALLKAAQKEVAQKKPGSHL